jgi:hypothetical protein
MSDPDDKIETTRVQPEQGEQRSASETIIQGMAATGALGYGTGKLLEGVAKVKEAFDGGQQPAPPADAQPPKDAG